MDARAVVLRAERRIVFVRGHKVLLDADLAELYGVPTKRLNEQVDLARKLEELEQRYDAQFRVVFDAIRALIDAPLPRTGQIGYRTLDP